MKTLILTLTILSQTALADFQPAFSTMAIEAQLREQTRQSEAAAEYQQRQAMIYEEQDPSKDDKDTEDTDE